MGFTFTSEQLEHCPIVNNNMANFYPNIGSKLESSGFTLPASFNINTGITCIDNGFAGWTNLSSIGNMSNIVHMNGAFTGCTNFSGATGLTNAIHVVDAFNGCFVDTGKDDWWDPWYVGTWSGKWDVNNFVSAYNNGRGMILEWYPDDDVDVTELNFEAFHNTETGEPIGPFFAQLKTSVCPNSVVNMDNAYCGFQYLEQFAPCGPNVINMYNCYSNTGTYVRMWSYGPSGDDYGLTHAVGPNVVNMAHAFDSLHVSGGNSDIMSPMSDKVVNMSYAFNDCWKAMIPNVGPNVEDMSYAFQSGRVCGSDPSKIYDLVSGPNVTNMAYAYHDVGATPYATTGEIYARPHVGPKVENIVSAFSYPMHLWCDWVWPQGFSNAHVIGDAECPDSVLNMSQAYAGTEVRKAVIGNGIMGYDSVSLAYADCYDIEIAHWGKHCDASMIKGTYVGGDSQKLIAWECAEDCDVTDISYEFNNETIHAHMLDDTGNFFLHMKPAVCPDSVWYMTNTYTNMENLLYAACGNNVIYMDNAYAGCTNLETAVIGPNVSTVEGVDGAYYGCTNLKTAYWGKNCTPDMIYKAYFKGRDPKYKIEKWEYADDCTCTDMNNAFSYFTRGGSAGEGMIQTRIGFCPPSVTNMSHAFDMMWSGTGSIETPYIGENVEDASYAYYSCSTLTSSCPIPDSVKYMDNLYGTGCYNPEGTRESSITIPYVGNNVISMVDAYPTWDIDGISRSESERYRICVIPPLILEPAQIWGDSISRESLYMTECGIKRIYDMHDTYANFFTYCGAFYKKLVRLTGNCICSNSYTQHNLNDIFFNFDIRSIEAEGDTIGDVISDAQKIYSSKRKFNLGTELNLHFRNYEGAKYEYDPENYPNIWVTGWDGVVDWTYGQ